MATYPAGIPALPRPSSATLMSTPGYKGSEVIDGIADEVEAIAAELGTNPSGAESTVAARHTAVEGRVTAIETELGTNPSGVSSTVADRFTAAEARVTALESAPATANQVVYMDFTGPSEPTRPTVPAGTKVWWTGPFLPANAAVGDKVDVIA